jgi:ABC-2 type transport system ATP-binding protein
LFINQVKQMEILRIDGLSKSYGRIKALDNLNLRIENGQVFGILGPNGSGKTTTLGIILSILKPDSGSFTWFENRYGSNPRKRIGAILETPNFYPYLNAVDNLDIIRHIKKVKEVDYDALLDLVELRHRKKSAFSTFSLGMKQRLAIAATMIGDPEVVIFDEPTNGLDPQGIADVRNTLQHIAETGKTVIMASHILDEVEKICSHVGILKAGKLLASGPVGSILSSDNIVEVSATDNEQLKSLLSGLSSIKSMVEHKKHIECTVSESMDPVELSTFLSSKGLVITHFNIRKRKLEEEFLSITKK